MGTTLPPTPTDAMIADAATDAPGPCATVNLVQFEAEVEKHSGGEIAVEIFDNSRLYRGDQPQDAVASGAIEMGSVATSQIVKKMSALDLFSQPFLLNSEATPGCTPRPSPCSPAAAETATCIQTVAPTTLPQAACACRIADPSQFAIVRRRDRGGCQ